MVVDIVRCKANSRTVCIAKQIHGGRELGTHAKQELRWPCRESIQRDGCFAKPGGALQRRIFFADAQLARHRYFGLQYSPAAAALFSGIANRLAGWVAISADIANSYPTTR